MKIAVHYSLYSCDELERSIRYLVKMAYTIKYYNENKLKEHFDIIIHIDYFTQTIFNGILHQEGISKDNIIYVKHARNLGARGTFWRFQSLYDINYDINVSGEVDSSLTELFEQLKVYINQFYEYPIMLRINKQVKNRNCFQAGSMLFKSNLIDQSIRDKFKALNELFENIETIPYGTDEQFMRRFIEKNLRQEKICIFITTIPNVFEKIQDQDKEGKECLSLFPNCRYIKSSEWRTMCNKTPNLDWQQNCKDVEPLKFLINMNGIEYYHYNCGFKRIKNPDRPRKSEFCEQRLLKLIDDII